MKFNVTVYLFNALAYVDKNTLGAKIFNVKASRLQKAGIFPLFIYVKTPKSLYLKLKSTHYNKWTIELCSGVSNFREKTI